MLAVYSSRITCDEFEDCLLLALFFLFWTTVTNTAFAYPVVVIVEPDSTTVTERFVALTVFTETV